jgi:hypothetical protein
MVFDLTLVHQTIKGRNAQAEFLSYVLNSVDYRFPIFAGRRCRHYFRLRPSILLSAALREEGVDVGR